MNTTNNKLRSQIILHGCTQKGAASEMGINARVFNNKLRKRTINGYVAHFTEEQKEWLAARFEMDLSEIE